MELQSMEEQRKAVLTPKKQLPFYQISDQYKGLKVIGLVADNSACGYYRVINPIHMLGMMGAEVHYTSRHSFADLFKYDIIIAPRQNSKEVYEVLRMATWENRFLIFDLDDDLHAVPPESPAWPVYHRGTRELEMIPRFIGHLHGMTTSTEEIARWYYQWNKNQRVCPNLIDFSLRDWSTDVEWRSGQPVFHPNEIERPEEYEDYITIGWSGGSTHQLDIPIMGPIFKYLQEHYSNVLIVLYCGIEVVHELLTKYGLDPKRIKHVTARHFLDYPEGLKGIDIGIAPLFTNQFNLAKCVVGSTRVYTDYGAPSIASLHSGREADTFYPLELAVQTQRGLKKTSHFYYAGEQPTVKIRTYSGYELEATNTHRVRNKNNEWVPLSELKIGDDLLLAGGQFSMEYKTLSYFWTCTRKDSKVSDKLNAKCLPKITFDETWAELLGFILGDGHISKTGGISVCVTETDIDLVDRLVYLFRQIGLEPTIKKAPGRKMSYVYVHSKPVAEFLIDLGMVHNKKLAKETLRVPDVIWASPRSVAAAFLRGLFESDGTVSAPGQSISISSCSKRLISDVQELLLWFGITSKMNTRNVTYNKTGVSVASILHLGRANTDLFREIGFVSKRKCARLAKSLNTQHSNAYRPTVFFDAITEISSGFAPVFDVSVPDGEEWIGGGFVQHNSNLKFLEMSAAGIAPVLSHVGPYAKLIRQYGSLCPTVGDAPDSYNNWITPIVYLMENPDIRKQMVQRNRQFVMDNFALERKVHQYPAAWKSMMEQAIAGEAGPPKTLLDPNQYRTFRRAGPNDPCPCGSNKPKESCCGNQAFG